MCGCVAGGGPALSCLDAVIVPESARRTKLRVSKRSDAYRRILFSLSGAIPIQLQFISITPVRDQDSLTKWRHYREPIPLRPNSLIADSARNWLRRPFGELLTAWDNASLTLRSPYRNLTFGRGGAVGRRWYVFGPYRLDPTAPVVLRDARPLPLTPKAVETLRVLVQSSGSLVSKERLLNEVWPGSFVGDGSLMRNISDLRKVLGQDARGEEYIETLPKRGYRFVAPVEELKENDRPHQRTIAILPLKLLGRSPRDNYIGLGIADAVITKLSTIRECTVRPTTVVSGYLRSQEDPAAIGRQLGVEFVLDGAVRRFGNRMRVTVRLVTTASQTTIWAETFEEEASDISSFEESISEELAGALALSLSTEQRKLLTKRYTENAEAYRFYLRGRFYWGKRSQEGLRRAIQHFNRAIEIDGEYALAYSALAGSYALAPMLAPVPSCKFMPKAKAAALTALDIDDTLVEARSALAFAKWHYDWDWDWDGAKREFRRILKFQPHDAVTRQWYGLLLVEQAEFSEAIAQARKAQSIDPVSVSVRGNLATVLHFAGRY